MRRLRRVSYVGYPVGDLVGERVLVGALVGERVGD